MLVGGLRSDQIYTIEFVFDSDENRKEAESEVCQTFDLKILSFTGTDKCLTQSSPYVYSDFAITMDGVDQEKQVILPLKDASNITKSLKLPSTDKFGLVLTIDYTDLYYIPIVKIAEGGKAKQDSAPQSSLYELKP